MANTITITKINYANAAAPGQVWTYEYKLASASTWTVASSNKVIGADGLLSTPLVISGLVTGSLYYVRASNNCTSPNRKYYTQQIQL